MPAYTWTGQTPAAEWHEGIPGRDLSAEEFAALDADQQATVRGSHFYAEVALVTPNRTSKPTEKPTAE